MTDLDRLQDCLCGAKHLAALYARAALESSNNGVREFFLAMHGEETHNQEILFHFVHTRGAYPVEAAPTDRVQQVKQWYWDQYNQLKFSGPPSRRSYRTADPISPPGYPQNPDHFGPNSYH